MVIKAEIEYKLPLRPNDDFIVRMKMGRQGRLRLIFDQEIVRKADEKLIIKARITSVVMKNGKPISSDILVERFKNAGIDFPEVT